MMEGLNLVQLIGNLGQPPDLRETQSGKPVLNIRLATNDRYQDKSGEWQDRTEWHTVVVWGKRATSLHKILGKGSHIYVQGRNQTRSWQDRDGNKRYTTEVVANKVILLDGKRDGDRNSNGHGGSSGGSGSYGGSGAEGGGDSYGDYGGSYGGGDFSDDDIPF
jgi:single-strand DNA-binding protein